MLVPYTRTIFKLFPVTLRISRSPSSVSFSQNTSSRFSSIGRDFTPSLNPTPVILVQDTFRHLSLLPDILSISTSPSLDNSLQSAIISDSRFGIDSTPSTNQTPVIIVLDTFIYLSLFPDILSISTSPPFDRLMQESKLNILRFGRDLTPYFRPIPVILLSDDKS